MKRTRENAGKYERWGKGSETIRQSAVGLFALLALCGLWSAPVSAEELVLGEETVRPAIHFIFEAAPKDTISPAYMHLAQKRADVHLEARVNWQGKRLPPGAPAGGFVGYLLLTAEVVNQRTGRALLVELTPHINLIDNLHYARNISLPGRRNDRYTVIFRARVSEDLSLHEDWLKRYGKQLMRPKTFTYKNVLFEKIAKAER